MSLGKIKVVRKNKEDPKPEIAEEEIVVKPKRVRHKVSQDMKIFALKKYLTVNKNLKFVHSLASVNELIRRKYKVKLNPMTLRVWSRQFQWTKLREEVVSEALKRKSKKALEELIDGLAIENIRKNVKYCKSLGPSVLREEMLDAVKLATALFHNRLVEYARARRLLKRGEEMYPILGAKEKPAVSFAEAAKFFEDCEKSLLNFVKPSPHQPQTQVVINNIPGNVQEQISLNPDVAAVITKISGLLPEKVAKIAEEDIEDGEIIYEQPNNK